MLAGLRIKARLSKSSGIAPFIARLLTIRYLFLSFNNQGILLNACFLRKASRSSGTGLEETDVTGQRLAVTSVPKRPPEEPDSTQKPKNCGERLLMDSKGILDAIQRLVCIGLGAWAFVRTNNYIEFAAIIAIGQIDTRSAKNIVERVLKAIINEYVKS